MKLVSALTALLLATPAAAEQISLSFCETALAKLKEITNGGLTASSPALGADGCVFRDIRFLPYGTERGVTVEARSLTIGGRGFKLADDGWISFDALSVSVDHLRFVPMIGDPTMNWLFDAQTARNGIDVGLMAERHTDGSGWDIQQLMAIFPGEGNRIDFNAVIDRLDISSRASAAVTGPTSRLMTAHLEIETHGLFEDYALMSVGPAFLSGGDDPEAAFEAMKKQTIAIIGKLDDASVSGASKAELQEMIAELPNPSGKLTLSFTSETGFSAANFLPPILFGVGDPLLAASSILADATIEVNWEHSD